MSERVILDPTEEAVGRAEFDVTAWIAEAGVDWGDATVAAYMSESSRGEMPVDFRIPNRTITIPLVLKAAGGTTFATAREHVQAKAALFQREGGWVKRVTSSGGTVYADVVGAALKLGGSWLQAHRDVDVDATLTLEAIPDFYEAEVEGNDNAETSATELVFTVTDPGGDYPARVRVVVDEDDNDTQMGAVWAFRSRHFSTDATAATRYEAEALQPLDTATRVALAGASGGTVVTHGTVSTSWTPMLGLLIGGTSYLTHTGTYQVLARVRSTSGTAVSARFVYDVGDLTLPEENDPWYHPGGGTAFFIGNFGQARLDPPPTGAHRWTGQFQTRGAVGTENFSIDKLWLVPVDDGYGMLTASLDLTDGLAAASARDEFNQTVTGGSDPLAGLAAAVGGTWTGIGDADDFVVEDTGHTAQRTAVSDAANVPRIAYVGSTNYTTLAVGADIKYSADDTALGVGVAARVTDINNYLAAIFNPNRVMVAKVVAGVNTVLYEQVIHPYGVNTWFSLFVFVDTSGRWVLWERRAATGTLQFVAAGLDSALATGGALASGKPGLYDTMGAATASTRNYNNFQAWIPATDAVMHASHSLEIGTLGIARQDTAGDAYGPVSGVVGDLPRLPAGGLEARDTEVFIKASRGDFDTFPDTGIDNISAKVYHRRSWLFVPGA